MGALLEGASLTALCAGQGAAAALLALHALGAILLGAGLFARLRPGLRREPAGLLCFVAIALCMPIIGALGLLVLSSALSRPVPIPAPPPRAVPPLPLPPRAPAGPPDPPADALRGILWHAKEPGRRVQALLRAAHLGGPGAATLLGRGLLDTDEEVRLLAHALLTRRKAAAERAP